MFNDAGITCIRAAVDSHAAEIFIDASCVRELARVLTYERRTTALDPAAQAACLAICKKLTRNAAEARTLDARVNAEFQLPICRDPDDQKFLELARACRADFLITKDRALLELARHKLRSTPFRIVTPREFADYWILLSTRARASCRC